MTVYIIGYDLNIPGQDYNKLIEAIKKTGTWWHQLDSTWIVESNLSAEKIRDILIQYLDRNDKILVAKLSGESAWAGFDKTGSDWLLNVLNRA